MVTAFIVERSFGGVTSGNRHETMGIHGSDSKYAKTFSAKSLWMHESPALGKRSSLQIFSHLLLLVIQIISFFNKVC